MIPTTVLLGLAMFIAYIPFAYSVYREIQDEIKRKKDHKR